MSRGGPARAWLPAAVALLASAALVAVHLALGGASYEPLEVADPCEPREVAELEERGDALERIALSAADGAACRLRVTREELVLALATPETRARFQREHRVSDEEVEAALRAGLERAVQDARRTGDLSGIEAQLLAEAVRRAPIGVVLDLLRTEPGRSASGALERLLREGAGGLLP